MNNNTKKFDSTGITPEMERAIMMLGDAGLVLTSRPAQIRRGTLEFKDARAGRDERYSITKSGYVRKFTESGTWSRGMHGYQLNAKRKEPYSSYDEQGDYVLSRVLKPGDYVGLAEDILRVLRHGRNRNESRQEGTRAKTVNEEAYDDPSATSTKKALRGSR